MHKLLIANRGEIAVRIARAAQELGLPTVAIVSDADAGSLVADLADELVRIGPAHPAKSYLNAEAILQAAQATGSTMVHPGYGFLSENAAFAQRVAQAGLIFVGPNAHTIKCMGNKAMARDTAKRCAVPTVPGSSGTVDDLEAAVKVAREVAYPMMIKASAGGGGRGIRVADDEAGLRQLMPLAQAEARAAFGDGAVYLERFIPHARHIEVQVLGDGKNVIHCYERECSLQRRRQKIMEEAPSPTLTPASREALCASAVRLATAVGYSGAGTMEYLFDERTGAFFFIEMNTRIQVEHPVSECVTGVDLVREMLRIAMGEPLRLRQDDIALRGAAIECRLNAEDPERNFMPQPGVISRLRWPGGPGVRVDSHVFAGYTVPPFYDSLLAKLIAWDEDRSSAIRRMQRALAETCIEGVTTTIALHQELLADPAVVSGRFHTGYLEQWMAQRAAGATQALDTGAPSA